LVVVVVSIDKPDCVVVDVVVVVIPVGATNPVTTGMAVVAATIAAVVKTIDFFNIIIVRIIFAYN
jgi:hypothetical protein